MQMDHKVDLQVNILPHLNFQHPDTTFFADGLVKNLAVDRYSGVFSPSPPQQMTHYALKIQVRRV